MSGLSKSGKVRICVVGLGIGCYHLTGYSKCANAEIVAVCDINEDKAKKIAEQYKVSKIYTSFEEMLKSDEIDAVSIAVPNYLHASFAIAAFEHGKHVICEKPLAMTPVEANAMVEAAKKSGKVFMTAFNNRYRADTRFLKKYIEDGLLGEIYYAKTGWLRRKGAPGMGGWFTTKSKSGGGPLIDLGVHVLDLTLWLMGNPKVVSVSGAVFAKFGHRGIGQSTYGNAEKNGSFDVEDLASAYLRTDTGAVIVLEASWVSQVKEDVTYTTLMGTEGGAELNPLRIYTDIQETSSDIYPVVADEDPYSNEISHFIECIVENKTPISTGEHGRNIACIIDAIYRSAKENREINL